MPRAGDVQRVVHLETGNVAEDVAERIFNIHRVVAGVGLLHTGQFKRRRVGAGDVQPIEPPLVLERRAGSLDTEADRLTGDAHRPDRLRDDLRRALRVEVNVAIPTGRRVSRYAEALRGRQAWFASAPCAAGEGRSRPVAGGVVEQAHLQPVCRRKTKVRDQVAGNRQRGGVVRHTAWQRRRKTALHDDTGELQRQRGTGLVVEHRRLARRNNEAGIAPCVAERARLPRAGTAVPRRNRQLDRAIGEKRGQGVVALCQGVGQQ